MTEMNYAEVFGLTEADLTAEVGEEERDVADPAEETQSDPVDSAKEQDVADPATGDEADEPEEQADAETHDEPDPEEKPPQSREERGRQAAARRQAEQEALIARVRAEEQEKAKATIEQARLGQHYGQMNPYTGKPIYTQDDFDAYQKAFAEEEQRSALQKVGLDKQVLDSLIENHPIVQQAMQAFAEQERIAKETREKEARARLDADIAEVGRMDARVKSVMDIGRLEKAGEIVARVQRGYTFADAYRLEYADALQGAVAGKAKQAAVQAVKAKAHMKPHESRGGGGVEIPRDVLAEYRLFNPDATDEEIYKHAAAAANQ